MMTEQEIGDLWRKKENYMNPLAFGKALIALERERCAKLCDSLGGDIDDSAPDEVRLAANSLADAIRSATG
jgi:hypothetical protein